MLAAWQHVIDALQTHAAQPRELLVAAFDKWILVQSK
jgi:hypothetical protein